VVDVLYAGAWVALIAQSTATRAEAITKQALLHAHMGTVFLLMYGQVF
jgi:hypothetical protein